MERLAWAALAAVVSISPTAIAGGGGQPPCTLAPLEVPLVPDRATEHFNDAWKVNDHGVIVGGQYWARWEGEDLVEEEGRALRWTDGEMEILDGTLVSVLDDGTEASGPVLYADARSLNRHGDVAGIVYTEGGDIPAGYYAAVWHDDEGGWRTIPTPEGASFGWARDINDAGHVIGLTDVGHYIWRGGDTEPELLRPLFPHSSCHAWAMNNLDMVTGFCADPNGRMRAVVWWGDRVWELKTHGGETNWGRAIDDLGRVAGVATDTKTGKLFPAAWSAWDPKVIKRLGEEGVANGNNNWGFSVGILGINGGSGADTPRGILWTPTGATIPLGSLGGLVFPRDVNNRGTVVGTFEIEEFQPLPFVCAP